MERIQRRKRDRRSRSEQETDGSLVMPRAGQTNVVAGVDSGAIIPIQNVSLDGPGSSSLGLETSEGDNHEEGFDQVDFGLRKPKRKEAKDAYSSKESGSAMPLVRDLDITSVQAPPLPFSKKEKIFWDSEDFPRSPERWNGKRKR